MKYKVKNEQDIDKIYEQMKKFFGNHIYTNLWEGDKISW